MVDNGFHVTKIDEFYQVEEKEYVIEQRRNYLRSIHLAREHGREIFYTDETFIKCPNFRQCGVWVDDVNRYYGDVPCGNGRTCTIMHVCSSLSGLVNGCLYVHSRDVKSLNTNPEMNETWMLNGDNYIRWLKDQVVPSVPENSVLVMDRASFHTRWDSTWYPPPALTRYILERGYRVDRDSLGSCIIKAPSINKTRLVRVDEKKLEYALQIFRSERILLKDVRKMAVEMKKVVKYEVQTLCESKNISVLFLPVHHPKFNPIEKVWATMKAKAQPVHTGEISPKPFR